METFTKRIANLLRILIGHGDYVIFKTIHLFIGTNKLPIRIQNILIIELLYIGDVIAITQRLGQWIRIP